MGCATMFSINKIGRDCLSFFFLQPGRFLLSSTRSLALSFCLCFQALVLYIGYLSRVLLYMRQSLMLTAALA